MLSQSKRNTDFYIQSTPREIGPGKYSSPKTQLLVESNAPFAATQKRRMHIFNEFPVSDKRSPAFKSKIARFSEKVQKTPIMKVVPETTQSSLRGKKFSLAMVRLSSRRQRSVPRARQIPANGHTGTKEDKVGPACYTPSYKFVKLKGNTAATKITCSKVPRNSIGFSETVPGPGEYEFNPESITKQNFNSKGHPCFISLVPKFGKHSKNEAESLIGPGCYNTDAAYNKSKRVSSKKPTKTLNKSLDLNVTSRTKVEDIPGPGHYNVTNPIHITIPHEDQSAPFNSTQRRDFFNEDVSRNPDIGPGTYVDVNNPIHSSFCKTLLKYAVDRGIMTAHGLNSKPFGVGGKRFQKGYFAPKEGPGPADYEYQKGECSEKSTRPVTYGAKAGFSTTTERFFTEKPQETLMESPKLALGPQIEKPGYDITLDLDNKKFMPKQTRTLYYAAFNGRNIGFDSTQSRFGPKLNKSMVIPGPGQYLNDSASLERNIGNIQRYRRSFNVTEEKFNPKLNSYLHVSSTNDKVGPGSYSSDSGVAKRSYNIHSYIP